MVQHWQEILPIDRYVVNANGLLHDYDRKVLTFLYQPLIGSACFSLYMTLWAELEENRLWSNPTSHHSLMNFMDMGLNKIYQSRIKLEAIGLLKVYEKKTENSRSFIYELLPPLTPEQFFLDGMLNIYLYRKIGKSQYLRLKRFFSEEKAESVEDYKEVTKEFQDVFTSSHVDSLTYNTETDEIANMNDHDFIGRHDQTSIQIGNELFNFELLAAGLNESLVPKKALTKKVKNAISNLAFLYDIDVLQMKNIVISALTEDNDINIEELRKSARDWYQFQYNDRLPSLVDRTQPVIHQTQKDEPKTKEEENLRYVETTSPRQFLKDISGGAEPSKADLQIVEDVMFQQKLMPGVINVLLQYVMLKSDMKLTKSYVEKIASHWARKKIKTAKEAFELARSEHRQYTEWAEGKKKPSSPATKKKAIRTEMLPDWFNETDDTSHKQEQSESMEQQELKKQELEELLKKMRSGG